MKTLPFFRFREKTSREMGLLVTSKNTYKSPARDVTLTSVTGRSGDLLFDNGRFKNVKIEYGVTAIGNVKAIARNVKAWLLAETGYFELGDTYDGDYYRLAAVSGDIDLNEQSEGVAKGKITFTAKPYRYLYDGAAEPICLYAADEIVNPEAFASLPLITIYGDGDITLYVNNDAFVFRGVDDYIVIDSEMMQAKKGTESRNNKMYTPRFPTFKSGANTISWTGDVGEVMIYPRWCTL